MSAVAECRRAWLKAERKARKRRQRLLDASRQELRESGQMADHYVPYEKSDLLTKVEEVTEAAAATYDETIDAFKALGKKHKKGKKKKAKRQLALVRESEPTITVKRIKQPKPKKMSRWQRIKAACKKALRWLGRGVKKMFGLVVEVLIMIDGLMTSITFTGKAAKRFYAAALA